MLSIARPAIAAAWQAWQARKRHARRERAKSHGEDDPRQEVQLPDARPRQAGGAPELPGPDPGRGQDQHGGVGGPPAPDRIEQLGEDEDDQDPQQEGGRQRLRAPGGTRGAAAWRPASPPGRAALPPWPRARWVVLTDSRWVPCLRRVPRPVEAGMWSTEGLRGPVHVAVGQRALEPTARREPVDDTRGLARPNPFNEGPEEAGARCAAPPAARDRPGSARPASGPAWTASSGMR